MLCPVFCSLQWGQLWEGGGDVIWMYKVHFWLHQTIELLILPCLASKMQTEANILFEFIFAHSSIKLQLMKQLCCIVYSHEKKKVLRCYVLGHSKIKNIWSLGSFHKVRFRCGEKNTSQLHL